MVVRFDRYFQIAPCFPAMKTRAPTVCGESTSSTWK